MPVPLKAMLCGLLLSGLSVKIKVPVTAPLAAGVNVAVTVQVLAAASVLPQVPPDIAKPLPLILLLTLIEAVSWFSRVTVFAALVLPTARLPKARLVSVTVVCASPVPVRAMAWGLALSGLSVSVRVPLTAPFAAGVNVTDTVQVLAAASVLPQVVAEIAKPLPLMLVLTLIAAVWWFSSVTILAALVLPVATSPKTRLAGVTVVWVSPVPVRAIACGLALSGLSVKVSAPVTAPSAEGVNFADTVQLLPAASVLPQVVAEIAKPLPLMPVLTLIEPAL